MSNGVLGSRFDSSMSCSNLFRQYTLALVAAAVVIASEYELCSVAALEAGAAGAPLASTTGGGMREHLEGFAEFFDPHSEEELRRAVEAAIARGRRDGQSESFLRRFDWSEIARRTLRAYEQVTT